MIVFDEDARWRILLDSRRQRQEHNFLMHSPKIRSKHFFDASRSVFMTVTQLTHLAEVRSGHGENMYIGLCKTTPTILLPLDLSTSISASVCVHLSSLSVFSSRDQQEPRTGEALALEDTKVLRIR